MIFRTSFIIVGIITTLCVPLGVGAAGLAERLSGRILLQVDSYGRAWYVEPVSGTRYYLQNGPAAYTLMERFGLGITDRDLAKIPTDQKEAGDARLVDRLRGRILLQVEQHGEAWYVNPVDGLRYYLADGQAAYQLMRQFGLGITAADLQHIPFNAEQHAADTAFTDVTAVRYDGQTFSTGQFDTVPLPFASLTKLMTAVVFLRNHPQPNWQQPITVTVSHLRYPQTYVGDDATSEIDLQAGDIITLRDAWTALLVASSNQAADIIAEASGLPRAEFVRQMNQTATELGMARTVFVDVSGLDAHNVGTTRDMARLAHAAFADESIAATSRQTSYQITTATDRTIQVINRNYSLLQFNYDGAKTGFLVEAQRNVAIQKNGQTVVVLHARSMAERNQLIAERLP